jgi:phenylalanyl-tRNA synthetase beta chain
MKIALDRIAESLAKPVTAPKAQEALIHAGLVVENIEQVGATQVLDVEVTSNRPDCLSYFGLARELATLLDRRFSEPEVSLVESAASAGQFAAVQLAAPDLCPYYSARVIRNVKVGPSPYWLRQTLEAIGLRSVNNVVDVTNFVLMETGQPLHAFDLDKLAGRNIIVRRATENETLTTLDGRLHRLDAQTLVIADTQAPVALAGIMGGKDTEVTSSTVHVLLESARFAPSAIRSAARRLGLSSDSSFRFERGVDPAMAEFASRRAAALIVAIAAGELAEGVLAEGTAGVPPQSVSVRLARVQRILGVEVSPSILLDIFQRLKFDPQLREDRIDCFVPSFRSDISREIDLIEEICRVWGYGNIPVGRVISHGIEPMDPAAAAARMMRQTLAACGWHETNTYSFVDQKEAEFFLDHSRVPVQVSDAVRKSTNFLRPSVWPGLLRARQLNQNNGEPKARLFEHARAYWQLRSHPAEAPGEEHRLALIGNDVAEVLGAVDVLLARVNPQAVLAVKPQDRPGLMAGAAGELRVSTRGTKNGSSGDRHIGFVGEFSRNVVKFYDLRHSAAGVELCWDALVQLYCPIRVGRPLPRFPAVNRDLSVVLENSIRWADVRASLIDSELEFLESVRFVGTWQSSQIGIGKKSCTFTLTFRDLQTTLRSEQVDAQVRRAVEVLGKKFHASLRV